MGSVLRRAVRLPTATVIVMAGTAMPGSPLIRAEDEAAGGDAGAGGDQHRPVPGHLVDRGAANLADRLGDAVHAVDIGLTELAAVRV